MTTTPADITTIDDVVVKVINLILILDISGSMEPNWPTLIDAVNKLIEEQKQQKDDTSIVVSLWTFNQTYQMLFDKVAIQDFEPLSHDITKPNGSTALFDAVGHIITKYSSADIANAIVAVVTDGQDNASKKVTKHDVKKLVDQQKEKGWTFIFFGANQDSFSGCELSMSHVSFNASHTGFSSAMGALNLSVSSCRSGGPIVLPTAIVDDVNEPLSKKVKLNHFSMPLPFFLHHETLLPPFPATFAARGSLWGEDTLAPTDSDLGEDDKRGRRKFRC